MRALPMDQIPGPVGLVLMPLSAADVFTTEQISDDVVAPDVIIDEDLFSAQGNLQIEHVLAWDVFRLQLFQGTSPLIVASEAKLQSWQAGITRDNTVSSTDLPASNAEAEHTRPSANQASTQSRFVDHWMAKLSVEENATGEIVSENTDWHRQERVYGRVQTKTNFDVSEFVMSDAHYHFWGDSAVMTANIASWSLGMRARRIEIDFLEVMFDRQTLLGILNAVGQVF